MVCVSVAEENVFDLSRIKAELLQVRHESGFHFIFKTGIDQHQALRRGQHVCGRFRVTDGINVIENLDRLEIRRGLAVCSRGANRAVKVVRFHQKRIVACEFLRRFNMNKGLRIVRLLRNGCSLLRKGDGSYCEH